MVTDDGLKTSAEWYKLYPNPVILDPDGWDREDFQHSFHERLITLMEFNLRRAMSTVEWEPPKEYPRN